ncbi:MAG: metallophosphoesterase [Selenomonadaceae bacterium]|nr:metallophosphoesterase [Selenomonadaceae bacterium]
MFLIYVFGFLASIIALGLISVSFLLDGRSKRWLYKILIATDLSIVVLTIGGFLIRAEIPNEVVDVFGSFSTVFLLTQFICGGLVLIALIARTIYRKTHKPTPYNPERRKVLAYGLVYPLMALTVSLYGNRIERLSIAERFYEIPVKKLPPELDGFKIAQITDIHIGPYFSLERLEKLLNQIVDGKPDLLAITGDIFDNVMMNPAAIKLVDSYTSKFKHGIYYCHGNHEHHRGITAIENELRRTKINWLVNQSKNVTSNLYILGVDYPPSAPIMSSGGRGDLDKKFEDQKREFVTKALEGVPYDSVCVLLAHHPEFIDDGAEKNIPLTLTGHTHGGQIGIFGYALLPLFKYTRGMFLHEDCYGYVSAGVGSWFPFRLGCPPEIVYFKLTQKNSA